MPQLQPPTSAAVPAARRHRLLSLDGGGIRGLISIEVLANIERELRVLCSRPDMVLADFFDLVAGTSTGAIIATAVSLGWSVERIRDFYVQRGREMFDHAHWWEVMRHRYEGERLRELLREVFGERTLGSEDLHSLLVLVLRNATTDQPWILSNNPRSRFNRRDNPACHLDLPLWQLVRASTAAPGYFPPETIRVGQRQYMFVDGSISSYTNPAFQAFLLAAAEPYDLQWPTGDDAMLLVSVGTGLAPHLRRDTAPQDYGVVQAAMTVPTSLILSTVVEQDMLCRIFGKCLNGHPLDPEIGSLLGASPPGDRHLFTYLRYNDEISQAGLERLGLGDIDAQAVQRIDVVEHVPELTRIGRRIAEQVQADHLARFCPQPR